VTWTTLQIEAVHAFETFMPAYKQRV